MRPWIVPFVALCGCATVQAPGTFTNPSRPPPIVGRSVAIEAVQCDAPGVAEGELPETVASLNESVDAQVASRRVELPTGNRKNVCANLATDRALYEDAVMGTDWKVSDALSGLIQRLATETRSDHVWLPVVRGRPCASGPGPEMARDTYSQPANSLDFDSGGCQAREADLGLFLFDATGQLLWKASAVTGQSELATREVANRLLMANLPPRAPADSALVTDTPP